MLLTFPELPTCQYLCTGNILLAANSCLNTFINVQAPRYQYYDQANIADVHPCSSLLLQEWKESKYYNVAYMLCKVV